MNKNYISYLFIFSLTFLGCATYEVQYANSDATTNSLKGIPSQKDAKLHKSFYLIGDAGGAKPGGSTDALKAFKSLVDTANTANDYAIFLGDNIYPDGLPNKKDPGYDLAAYRLDAQIETVTNFDGTTYFIPGNHDWYAKGLVGLKRQEKYIEDALDDNEAFQPENGCPIEIKEVSEQVTLIVLDTQWYLEDWDEHPTINDECEIRTREAFFLEIENELKKHAETTILITMHHPMYTNGIHGGRYHISKHLYPRQNKFPLPGLASLVTQIRAQGGVSIQDRYNKRYNNLMKRLATLAADSERVVFASGHEHSIQYIEHEGIKQIVSGSGAKQSAATIGEDGLFSYGGQGFAILDVYDNQSSIVKFYTAKEGKPELVFAKEILPPIKQLNLDSLPTQYPSTVKATIYAQDATDVDGIHESLWGDHYRETYGTPVEAKVAFLDTFRGGFTVDRKGGGHQTRSLRLIDKSGRNYNLRALRKSATQFLQTVAFKETFVEEELEDTFTEDVILDFYTAAHPYGAFVIADMANEIGVLHTNPELLYVPKQKALGKYNAAYGNELYMLEERPDDDFVSFESFGYPDAIDSTDDMYANLRKDEEYQIDEEAYVRARVFDMLIGDWDRHADQWRWARFDENGKKIYRPIPRDRDQVFSKFDGALLGILKTLLPATKQFQNFDGDLRDIKWLNEAGIKMDRALTKNATKATWLEQATYIQEQLSATDIEKAFLNMPKEVRGETTANIIAALNERKEQLVDIAARYYEYLADLIVITGTDKDDHFEITRLDNATRIQVSRIKDDTIQPPFIDRMVYAKETKEVWLYGLDDDDRFRESGTGKNKVRIRLIGGQNNDSYTIENGKKIKIYEHRTKPNTIIERGKANIKRSNIYSFNTYDPLKKISSSNAILPAIGFNPDDGFLIGLTDVYTTTGFKNDPYESRHSLNAGYYFATDGVDLKYNGVFANAFGQWNLTVGGRFTNDSYARNFFGFGNETVNLDDERGFDYNRVRNRNIEGSIGVVSDNTFGSKLRMGILFENIQIQQDASRYIVQEFEPASQDFFEGQSFLGLEGAYTYASSDNPANPTRGMDFKFIVGTKMNLNETDRFYAYIKPLMGFYNSLSQNRKLVLKTLVQAHVNFGDDYEFYQAAALGARTGLRGYRFERFSGESALAGSADLRYSFDRFGTFLVPLQLGIYGGADLGRVWLDGEDSERWHSNFGGGLWINAVDTISGQVGAFASEDGVRIHFTVGVKL